IVQPSSSDAGYDACLRAFGAPDCRICAMALANSGKGTGSGAFIRDTRYRAGMPKLRFCPSSRTAVAMPMTSPWSLKMGPPDEPGAMGAEIWRTSTPASPGRIASLSPSATTGKPRASTRTTARSCSGLAARTSTTSSSRSGSVTFTRGPQTMTCRFVAIHPSDRTTKPVPSDCSVRIVTIAGSARNAISAGDSVRDDAPTTTAGAAAGGAAFADDARWLAHAARARSKSARDRMSPLSVTHAARARHHGHTRTRAHAIVANRRRRLRSVLRCGQSQRGRHGGRPGARRSGLARLPARLLRAAHVDDPERAEHAHDLVGRVDLEGANGEVRRLPPFVVVVLKELAHGEHVEDQGVLRVVVTVEVPVT